MVAESPIKSSLIQTLEAEKRTWPGHKQPAFDRAISIVRQHEAESKQNALHCGVQEVREISGMVNRYTGNKVEIADISDDDPVGDAYANGYVDGYKAKAVAVEQQRGYSVEEDRDHE